MVRRFRQLQWLVVACLAVAILPAGSMAADPVLLAAGDIACDPADPNFNAGKGTESVCRQKATSDLILATPSDAVLALGDLQYDSGMLDNFQRSYALSWGRVKDKTYPVIGNHEGTTASGGTGYCAYFGAAAHCNANGRQGGAAFYSFDIGAWHVVVLNSNCVAADGCDVGSPQYSWLDADLAGSARPCTLAAWHHPRWSSGHHGSNAFMQPIWERFHARGGDLVLSGHSHSYERFAPIDAAGAVDASGVRSFVVGTGGVDFAGLATSFVGGSEVLQNTTYGVLRLVLHATSYEWSFVPEAGRVFGDSGSQGCRGFAAPDTQPPSRPSNLTVAPAAAPGSRRGGKLLARWRLKARVARRSLARGWVAIPKRRWARTVIRVRVAGRLAGRRKVATRRALKVHLANWSKTRHYRRHAVTVTIAAPLRR